MIKIQDVNKGENYYTITFTDGLEAYGVLVTLVDKRPVYVEFMEFAKNKQDLVVITEEDSPEEYKRLKEKYFDVIMESIQKE